MTPEETNAILRDRITRRVADLGTNVTRAGKDAGLSASVIRNIFEGKSLSPRQATIDAIARALQTTPDWLLGRSEDLGTAAQPMEDGYRDTPTFFDNTRPIPLHASAHGGDGTSLIIDPAPIDYVPRPHILDDVEGAYAIVITGDSMVPAFRPGERAWVDPSVPMMRGEDHVFRCEDPKTGEWRALIKEMRSWTRDAWTVAQHNPARVFDLDRQVWRRCHRVVGKFARR